MESESQIYEVHIALVKDQKEHGIKQLYYAAGSSAAVFDGVRWALNRQRALGDVFGTVRAVTIHRYAIGTVAKDGSIKTGVFGFNIVALLEWKNDHAKYPTLESVHAALLERQPVSPITTSKPAQKTKKRRNSK